jgi:hypothetical protein
MFLVLQVFLVLGTEVSARVAYRSNFNPNNCNNRFGFRVLLRVSPFSPDS